MNKKISYLLSADIVRVLAILGVVVIHTMNIVYARPDYLGGISWWIANIFDSLSRSSVPLFIILSGYLILNKDESFEKTLKRTFRRILIPLLAWTIIYYWWNSGTMSSNNINLSLVYKIFTVNVFHLYFLIIMIGLYTISPLLRSYLRNASIPSQNYTMILFLLIGIVETAFQYLYNQCGQGNFFTYWLPYTGLFIAGYVLGNKAKNIKRIKSLTGVYLGALGVTAAVNYYINYLILHNHNFLSSAGCIANYTNDYLSVNTIIMSLCAFILLMHFPYSFIKSLSLRKFIHSVAVTSFGIYLCHLIIVHILDYKFHFFDHITTLWLLILIKWIVVFVLSYVATAICIRIPVLRRIFGS